jgi:TatD DNase family protein
MPLDRVLVETDCPYLAPVPHRGQRNEPAYVVHTATVLAQTLGVPIGVIAEHTTRNARALFGI